MSLLFDKDTKRYSGSHNKVYINENHNNRRCVMLETYHYKELVNPAQIDHVINDIVVNRGFLMSKQTSEEIEFTHSTNTDELYTIYIFFVKTLEIEKITRKVLEYL